MKNHVKKHSKHISTSIKLTNTQSNMKNKGLQEIF